MESKYWSFTEKSDTYTFKHSECKNEIEKELRDKIVNDLAAGMPEMAVKTYFDFQEKIFNQYNYVVCAFDDETGQCVGLFGSKMYAYASKPFLYLWTIFIQTQLQSSLLFYKLVFSHINRIKNVASLPHLFALKTYHPTVYRLLSFLERVDSVQLYPSVKSDNKQHPLLPKAGEIAKIIASESALVEETGALVGGMGTAGIGKEEDTITFYPSMPQSSSKAINNYFAKALGKFDQLLCVLNIPDDNALYNCFKFIETRGNKKTM